MTQLQQHAEETIRKRHSERQRKRMRIMKIRRTVFFTLLSLTVVFIIMFCTPVFRIRGVEVKGNQKIETAEITESLGEIEGKNLFRAKISAMKKNVLKIPYIDTVDIERVIFRSKLSVKVTECEEAAAIAGGNGYIIIDSTAKVLAEVQEKPGDIPEVTGLSITNVSVGEKLNIEEQEKFEIMVTCLEEMKKIGILGGVKNISVADAGNITFNYEDRLDALCGSSVELEKKLSYFKSAINSSRLKENARGTIDLTTTGKAIYSP